MAARTALLRISADSDRPAPRLSGMIRFLLRKSSPGLFDHYRPERHSMRGPGPRWRAKHGQEQAAVGRDG